MEKVYYKFINKKNENSIIRIYGTDEILGLLTSKVISQYFIDGTYKVLPNENFYKKNIYALCLCALLSEETEEGYNNFYNIIKCKYILLTLQYLLLIFKNQI